VGGGRAPEQAEPLVEAFVVALQGLGAPHGPVGADMAVELVNDGR
jgi:D-Tyr-tRNAtyr deacylase